MKQKNLILVIFLAIFIMVNFVSALIRDVECASDYDCRLTNTICDLNTFKCVQANVNLQGEVYENTQISEISEENLQNNSIASALIIALGIIVGLIVLGLLIKKRNK